jgi:3-phenylpropionate/trans-cinnamate dioxygenase ferredoxin reductase component
MSAASDPVVIVGGGMAGGRAAEFLATRSRGAVPVVLVTEEPHRPYNRPPLSKPQFAGERAAGRSAASHWTYFRPADFYAKSGIELRLQVRAQGLDPAQRTLWFDDGSELRYSQLLIASGCRPRLLKVDGAHLRGIHYLRNRADADGFWASAGSAVGVVIIGGGFIGCEVAASLRHLGISATVVESGHEPLAVALGDTVGKRIRAMHETRGVRFKTGTYVAAVLDDGGGTVRGVRLANGEEIAASTVLVGIGVDPAVDWLDHSGIETDGGVMVDAQCRTSAEGVFAAGDVARWTHPAYGSIRVEHETNAQSQAVVAARNILGLPTAYRQLPYVWSDQYQTKIEYIGHSHDWSNVLLNENAAGFAVAYLRDGRIRAVASIGRPDVTSRARRALEHGPVLATDWPDLTRHMQAPTTAEPEG